jgi:hypothetical protein
VRVSGRLPDGRRPAFLVRVEVDRYIPTPTCGVIDGPEFKVEPVWRVASAEPVDAPEPAVQ